MIDWCLEERLDRPVRPPEFCSIGGHRALPYVALGCLVEAGDGDVGAGALECGRSGNGESGASCPL